MKIWLEFNQEEGKKLLDFIKDFKFEEYNEKSEKDQESGTKITKEIIRKALNMKKIKTKDAKVLMEKYGASNLSEIREEDYEAFLKETETL